MKPIGILKCDSVLEQFQRAYGEYPDMLQRLLQPRAPTVHFTVHDVEQGVYPSDPAECGAYLITGSRASVFEPLPWIAPLMEWVRELHRRRIPTIGICFGHQLLAQALGGLTERSNKGWGVGVRSVGVCAEASWMQPPLRRLSLLYSHQDQVTRLPPGARRLAGDEFCPNAMFELDDVVLGIQGHPEFEPGYAACLLDLREAAIGAARARQARRSLDQPRQHRDLADWMLRFLGLEPEHLNDSGEDQTDAPDRRPGLARH